MKAVPLAIAALALCAACDEDADEGMTGCAGGRLDRATDLCWQDPPSDAKMTHEEAVSYCNGLSRGGATDWRLPTISELRSLVRDCGDTVPDGICGASDECFDDEVCYNIGCSGCPAREGPGPGGCYWDPSLSGKCSIYWSSTRTQTTRYWFIKFDDGDVYSDVGAVTILARCVRDGS
jgi:hypothetical protein